MCLLGNFKLTWPIPMGNMRVSILAIAPNASRRASEQASEPARPPARPAASHCLPHCLPACLHLALQAGLFFFVGAVCKPKALKVNANITHSHSNHRPVNKGRLWEHCESNYNSIACLTGYAATPGHRQHTMLNSVSIIRFVHSTPLQCCTCGLGAELSFLHSPALRPPQLHNHTRYRIVEGAGAVRASKQACCWTFARVQFNIGKLGLAVAVAVAVAVASLPKGMYCDFGLSKGAGWSAG